MIFNLSVIMAPRQGAAGPLVFLIQMVAIFAIFYFLLIRPQRQAQRRHQQLLAGLKRGDEVMTEGGIIGEVLHLKDDRVLLKTGENTRITVARPKIARVFTAGSGTETEKS